jgi:hypothetical protein
MPVQLAIQEADAPQKGSKESQPLPARVRTILYQKEKLVNTKME